MEYAILLSSVQRAIYSDRRSDDPGRINFGAIGDAIGRKESKPLEKRRKRTGVPRKSREINDKERRNGGLTNKQINTWEGPIGK